jgi:RNA polymerase sigma factor (sigma-70 family)
VIEHVSSSRLVGTAGPSARTEADDGFEEAFDELFPRAVRLAHRLLGDRAAAEDVAAEAMARAYARWPKVAGLPYRDGWVLKVTTNLVIDRLRRRRPEIVPAPVDDFEDGVALRLALSAALLTLAPRQRQAVAPRYLGGLSDREVAQALGISLGSVKTHIHRGLNALRARLGASLEEVVPVALD